MLVVSFQVEVQRYMKRLLQILGRLVECAMASRHCVPDSTGILHIPAVLEQLSQEVGTVKKNRPELNVDDLLLGRTH